ncbi:MAG TPA: protein phosphatase 2C domain-containing protein [Acidobacteriaceae bacterium]|jgi:serine/threonine protein phosphatase PrpC
MKKASPQSPALLVSVGAQSDVGSQRTENQDRITRASTPFGDLFVVADGVGGYQGGAEAAQLTVEGFADFLSRHGELPVQQALQEAARLTSEEMVRRGASDPARRNMGSTVVLCIVQGVHTIVAHAGDSRAYLAREGRLERLTRDHSVVERLVSEGILDQAQAREHPDANVLTRVLGQPGATLDIRELELRSGDGLLLCSDGLWGYAGESEIETIATSQSLSATGVAQALLNLALGGGGGDNISIQFLRFEAPASQRRRAILLGGPPRRLVAPAVVLGVLLALGTGALVFENYRHPVQQKGSPAAEAVTPKPPAPEPEPVPAASSAKAKSSGNAQPKTEIAIVRDSKSDPVNWAAELRKMAWLMSPRSVDRSEECPISEEEEPALYYAPGKRDVAARTRDALKEKPVIVEMSRDDLEACGGRELLIMPELARPRESRDGSVEGQAKSGIETAGKAARQKIEKGAQRVLHPQP